MEEKNEGRVLEITLPEDAKPRSVAFLVSAIEWVCESVMSKGNWGNATLTFRVQDGNIEHIICNKDFKMRPNQEVVKNWKTKTKKIKVQLDQKEK